MGCRVPALEIVVVLIIVFVLLAMLFPMTGPRPAGLRTKAKQDALAIVHAVETYVTDYERLPQLDPEWAGKAGATDMAIGDPAAGMRLGNETLFNILRDIDRAPNANSVQNPKHIVYYAAPAVSNAQKPKEGFVEKSGGGGAQGALYDPWGSQYNLVLDSSGDNAIDVKGFYSDFGGPNVPQVSVGAFSLGRDRKLGRNGDRKYQNGEVRSDDVVSWSSN